MHFFDVGGTEVVELTELAERIAMTFPTKINVVRRNFDFREKSEDRYVADVRIFLELCSTLGINPANLNTCIANTKNFLAV